MDGLGYAILWELLDEGSESILNLVYLRTLAQYGPTSVPGGRSLVGCSGALANGRSSTTWAMCATTHYVPRPCVAVPLDPVNLWRENIYQARNHRGSLKHMEIIRRS
jgi:hypothetical protein